MLRMATFKVGDPMPLFVEVECYNFPYHKDFSKTVLPALFKRYDSTGSNHG